MNHRLLATAAGALGLIAAYRLLKKRNGIHNIRRLRRQKGAYYALLPELKKDPVEFKRYLRMSPETFNKLLELLSPTLEHRSIREPIGPEQRLVVCLRYLGTGASFRSLAFEFYLGVSTVQKVVHSTCRAIYDVLQQSHLRTPSTEGEWLAIANDFQEKWQLPNCLGAINGKHVNMMIPFTQNALTIERRIFNYRLSRARRVVESAFGIMAQKWRLLLKNIETAPEYSDGLVKAICCLHNFLIDEGEIRYGTAAEAEEATENDGLRQAPNIRSRHANRRATEAEITRQTLIDYVNGPGAVEWQNEFANVNILTQNTQ